MALPSPDLDRRLLRLSLAADAFGRENIPSWHPDDWRSDPLARVLFKSLPALEGDELGLAGFSDLPKPDQAWIVTTEALLIAEGAAVPSKGRTGIDQV